MQEFVVRSKSLILAVLAIVSPVLNTAAQSFTLTSANWNCADDRILVTFNQAVDPVTATNLANYSIDHGITVSWATPAQAANEVWVFAHPMGVGTNYTLTVNNVTSLSSPPVTIPPNSQTIFGCVTNSPPTIDCPTPITLDCTNGAGGVTPVTVQAGDPDGDGFVLHWSVNGLPTQTNSIPAGAGAVSTNVTLNFSFPPGTNTVAVTIPVSATNSVSCSVPVMVSMTPNWSWITTAGASADAAGSALARDAAGNIYVTGRFRNTGNFGAFAQTSAGDYDIYVAKLNAAGNFLWATRAGGPGADQGRGIAFDGSGHLYVVGMAQAAATFGSTTLSPGGGFIAKLDANTGNFLWAANHGSSLDAVACDAAGIPYAAGRIYNVIILKLNPTNGSATWTSTVAGMNPSAAGIAVDAAGNVLVTGGFGYTSTGAPASATFGSTTLSTYGETDLYVTKLDNSGAFLWANHGGGPGLDFGSSITVDPAGNAYVIGSFNYFGNNTAAFGPFTLTSAGNFTVCVAKLDPSGSFVWAVQAGGNWYDEGHDIALDSAGDLYITGGFTSSAASFGSTTLAVTSPGLQDIFVSKLDAAGNFLWAGQAGGAASDVGAAIVTDPSGCPIVTGLFESNAQFSATTLTTAGTSDAFVAQICPPCVTPTHSPTNLPPVILCPNSVTAACGSKLTLAAQASDPDGDALSITWIVNGSSVLTTNVPGTLPQTYATLTLTPTLLIGTNSILITVTDSAGNTATCQSTVTLVDTQPPVVLCPKGTLTLPAGDQCSAVLPTMHFKASDNCTPTSALVITQSPPAGALLPVGAHLVTITVTDAAGNQTTCQVNVVVKDTTPPIVICDMPKTVVACQATVPNVVAQAVVTDNCSKADNIVISQNPPAGTLVNVGTYPITVTATDAAGNTSTCTVWFSVVSPPGSFQPLNVFGTGLDNAGTPLPGGSVDPHYALISSANPAAQVSHSNIWVFQSSNGWVANDSGSKWIGPRADGAGVAGGMYVYRTTFTVPANAGIVTLNGKWATDNGASIRLNGNPVGIVSAHNGFGALKPFTISSGFVPGLNTLDFAVTNQTSSGGAQTITGLRVELSGTASTCPTNCMPAVIVQHPLALNRPIGSYATFSTIASGSPNLAYQWFLNSTPISGATSAVLTVGPLTTADAGLYSVRVTNSCGTVRSQTALLRIKKPLSSIVGQWDFMDPANPLGATIGQDLEFADEPEGATAVLTDFDITDAFGIPTVNGHGKRVMQFPAANRDMGYIVRAPLGSGQSRSAPAPTQFTLIFDLYLPESLRGEARVLLRSPANIDLAPEWDLDSDGTLRVDGVAHGKVAANAWSRLALAVDLAGEHALVTSYIDGAVAGRQVLTDSAKRRWAQFTTPEPSLRLLILTGGSEPAAPGYVSAIQLHNMALPEMELASLGVPDNGPLAAVNSVEADWPLLSHTVRGDQLVLTWEVENALLEETAEINSSIGWTPSQRTVATEVSDGTRRYAVRIPLSNLTEPRFYRLSLSGTMPRRLSNDEVTGHDRQKQ